MKKLGFLVMPLMVVSFLASCNQPTPAPVVDVAHTFHFLGTNCTINGENDYSHDIFEKDKNVQYTIIADDDYALPETIESDISYERTDKKVAVITINEIKADINLNVKADPDPMPTQQYSVNFIGDGCAATLSGTSESFTYDLVEEDTNMSLTIASDDIEHHKLPSSSSNIGFTINGEPASPTSYEEGAGGTYLLKFTVIGNTTIHIKASDICTVTVHNNVPDASKPTEKYVLNVGDIFSEETATAGLPPYDSHYLVGWYTDEGFTHPYDFTLKVFEDIDLYVCWVGGDINEPLTFTCVGKTQGESEEDPLYFTLYNDYQATQRDLEYRIIKKNEPTPGDWIKVNETGVMDLPITGEATIKFLNTGTKIDEGDQIQLRGDNSEGWSCCDEEEKLDLVLAFATSQYYKFDISNNIMSLINYDNFAQSITIPNEGCFCALFSPGCWLYNEYYSNFVETQCLCLPATILTKSCYSSMFDYAEDYGKTIISVPELPATVLADSCYEYMFSGCTSLVTAPDLPATKLADSCYQYMFSGCTSLTQAPELSVDKLEDNCYWGMFSGCSSIVTAPGLPATKLADSCYQYMFSGCSSIVTAPVLPATILTNSCYEYMFAGCTSLINPPELSVTTLAEGCYWDMFNGCTSLVTAPYLPAVNLNYHCYRNMFHNCYSLKELTVGFGANNVWPDVSFSTYYWLDSAGRDADDPTLYWKGDDDPNRTIVPKDSEHVPDGWSVKHWE